MFCSSAGFAGASSGEVRKGGVPPSEELYVRIGDDRERRDATVIGTELGAEKVGQCQEILNFVGWRLPAFTDPLPLTIDPDDRNIQ